MGERDPGVSAAEGEGAGLGTGQLVERSGAGLDTWGEGTAMAGVWWADWNKWQSQMKLLLRETRVRHNLVSYATTACNIVT